MNRRKGGKRGELWDQLERNIKIERTKADAKLRGKSPSEIVVQRLSAEADNKQTYRPVQPRVFVDFDYQDLTLTNLKKACAKHFGLSTSSCDILVTNKGPSCTNITQIPHRKGQVYLVRFVLQEDLDYEQKNSLSPPTKKRVTNEMSYSQPHSPDPKHDHKAMVETQFPNSFSVADLLKAGKLVQPKMQKKVVLTREKFDITSGEWKFEKPIEVLVETEKFSSGGFRDTFKAVSCSDSDIIWVVKTYNPKAKDSIEMALNTTVEKHTRKQVQMHAAAARALTKKFELKVPVEFGESFSYNHTFFTMYEDNPATVEEFVSGAFVKYVNNNGDCCNPPAACSSGYKDIFAKAQCLVHFSYVSSNEKLMLLDIQGARYMLYDPEIATSELFTDTNEVYFCCGNMSTEAIKEFKKNHTCSNYCKMLELKAFTNQLSSKSSNE